jgi:hypothetical protein
MQAALQLSAGPFSQADAMPEGTVPENLESRHGHHQQPIANWHRSGRASPQPARTISTPEHKAGPMRQHRPSLLIPTLQPVRTIGMWQICLTVPPAPT